LFERTSAGSNRRKSVRNVVRTFFTALGAKDQTELDSLVALFTFSRGCCCHAPEAWPRLGGTRSRTPPVARDHNCSSRPNFMAYGNEAWGGAAGSSLSQRRKCGLGPAAQDGEAVPGPEPPSAGLLTFRMVPYSLKTMAFTATAFPPRAACHGSDCRWTCRQSLTVRF